MQAVVVLVCAFKVNSTNAPFGIDGEMESTVVADPLSLAVLQTGVLSVAPTVNTEESDTLWIVHAAGMPPVTTYAGWQTGSLHVTVTMPPEIVKLLYFGVVVSANVHVRPFDGPAPGFVTVTVTEPEA